MAVKSKFCIIPMLLLAMGCGAVRPESRLEIDPELQPFVDTFVKEALDRGRVLIINNIVVKFGEPNLPKAVGVCVNSLTPVIKIQKSFFDGNDSSIREVLLFHELGHCILHKNHDTAFVAGFPKSIMFPEVISGWHYEHNRKEYLDELFN